MCVKSFCCKRIRENRNRHESKGSSDSLGSSLDSEMMARKGYIKKSKVHPAYLADVEAGAGTFQQTTVVTGVPQQDDKFYGANNKVMGQQSFHQASTMGQSQPEPEAEMSVPLSQSEAAKALHDDSKMPKKKK